MPAVVPGAIGLDIDLNYVQAEDRLHLTVRTPQQRADWWLTRSLTLRLVEGWLAKLDQVPLPQLPQSPWRTALATPPVPAPRDLSQEHGLSLEFDAPRRSPAGPTAGQLPVLVAQLTLAVTSTDCKLTLVALGAKMVLMLTRREAHTVLEMLATKVREAGWLGTASLPPWLGEGR